MFKFSMRAIAFVTVCCIAGIACADNPFPKLKKTPDLKRTPDIKQISELTYMPSFLAGSGPQKIEFSDPLEDKIGDLERRIKELESRRKVAASGPATSMMRTERRQRWVQKCDRETGACNLVLESYTVTVPADEPEHPETLSSSPPFYPAQIKPSGSTSLGSQIVGSVVETRTYSSPTYLSGPCGRADCPECNPALGSSGYSEVGVGRNPFTGRVHVLPRLRRMIGALRGR